MKILQDMSELEILALTNDKIEQIIKFRKAQEGIKLLEKPNEPTYEEEIEEDLTFYQIENLQNFCFSTLEEASVVVDNLKGKLSSAYYLRWSDNPVLIKNLGQYEKQNANLDIKTFKCYSPALSESAKQIQKRNSESKRIYEENKKEYDQYVDNIQWLIDEVWNKVFEIRNKYNRLSSLQNSYAEYLVLANNDEEIATAFLRKANLMTDSELMIVKGEKIKL